MRANNNGGDNHLYMMDTLFDDNNNNIMISGCVNGMIGGNGGVVVGRNGLKRHRDDTRQRDDIVSFKRNMTLDFNAPASNKKEKLMKTCVLESPDLKKINIGSPEMEQMIIANGLMSGTTPTPGVLPQYFLKQESEATEEQEQFSRGFTEALDKLHHQTSNGSGDDIHMNGLISDHSNSHHTISMSNHHQQQQQQHQQQHHQSNHSSNSVTIVDQQQQQHQHQQQQQHHSNNSVNNNGLSVVTSNGYANHSNNNHNNSNSVDDSVFNVSATIMPVTTSSNCVQFAIPSIPPHEQYVNVATSNGGEVIISGAIESSNCNTNSNSSSNTCGSALPTYASHISNSQQMAPIDMGEQERIKLERKRLRNRIAASKCRRRKLERISRLEDKVKSLKGENAELSIVVNKLRDQVCSLKQQVMDHVKCGCQLMVNQQ